MSDPINLNTIRQLIPAVALLLLLTNAPAVVAQQKATEQQKATGQQEATGQQRSGKSSSTSSTSSGLTEGLLDLLKDPKSENASDPTASKLPTNSPAPTLEPSDVGLEGENLSEETGNPLNAVRQSMLITAGLLQRGVTGSDTQRLQQDIVQRLDEIIEQLQNQPPPSNKNDSSQSKSKSQSSQNSSGAQQTQSSTTTSKPKEDGESDASGNQNQPGNSGNRASGEVELKDPAALQQSVWGQLPDRVKSQLQSRMVEQFLPSHKEQIEAYFRALLQSKR